MTDRTLYPASQAVGATDEDQLKELIACTATGSEECFERMYDQLAPYIYSLVWRVTRNQSHAEEVTQEVFLEVWQKAPLFDPAKGSARSWVMVIAHRRAVDRVRSVQASYNRDMSQGTAEFQEVYEHVHETVNSHLEAEHVAQALASLPVEYTEVITLAYFGGLTQRDIAGALNVPLGTVKSRTRAGLLALRTALEGVYGEQ
ncbi:sigma-70 family RNA polymerase sigma factor [Rothia sp. ZJ1223]|uniref:sigma-70 family RNA polymerase sigma factor n=1 Tax=Rothia sp. ZJ1223 TaxID=2811098 RepID=UPI00195D38D9|nr:sigma-70 family RNA polymerase sigma factor [Rothia sp. ZJ1223]MBM7051717.1 sigma-70 family RNA polymerase sigma factor [Rothia sp. ZJ1223]